MRNYKIGEKTYRVKGSCILLDDVTREVDPTKLVNGAMLIFIGIVIGIFGCYLMFRWTI